MSLFVNAHDPRQFELERNNERNNERSNGKNFGNKNEKNDKNNDPNIKADDKSKIHINHRKQKNVHTTTDVTDKIKDKIEEIPDLGPSKGNKRLRELILDLR